MGVPFYGRSFVLQNSENHSIGSPHNGAGIAGHFTKQAGIVVYNELCEIFKMKKSSLHLAWESKQMAPYAYYDEQWISYDDNRSIALKADYVKRHKLGGIMIWSIEMDDFRGVCDAKRYPLLRTINDGLRDVKANNATYQAEQSLLKFSICGLILSILHLFFLLKP